MNSVNMIFINIAYFLFLPEISGEERMLENIDN